MNIFKLLGRAWQIFWILYKYKVYKILTNQKSSKCSTWNNFTEIDKHNSDGNLAKALEEMGPLFIKLGQTLSTRPDIIGKNLTHKLSILRDRLPAFDSVIAINYVEKDFTSNINNIFSEFNSTPIAAASIAQVHKATTICGNKVAVKILRPNIEKLFKQDLNLAKFVFRIIDKRFSKLKRLKLLEVIDLFERTTKLELDLRFEAAALSEFYENQKDDPNIYTPKIYWDLTSKNILTTEWIDGFSIESKQDFIKHNINIEEISKNIAVSFFNQAYGYGFFHGDLHPGNILITAGGKIAFIDFGIMGRLSKDDRIYVASILYGFLKRDYLYVAKTHIKAGYVPRDQDVYIFAQACRSIGEPIIGLPVSKISIAKLLAQLFKITEDFKMETQPQLLLLQKTMMMVEGVGLILNPKVNMWQLAEPWIENWAKKNLGFDAKLVDSIADFIDEGKEFFAKIKNLEDKSLKEIDKLPYKINYISIIITAILSISITIFVHNKL